MLDGADVPYSPAWWFKTLATQLQNRRYGRVGNIQWSRTAMRPTRVRPPLDVLHDHFRGDPPLPGVAESYKEAFRAVVRMGRLNVAELIATARTDRMGIAGFQTAAAGDELGDKLAGELMAATDLGVKAGEIHDGMQVLADSYAMCTPVPRGEKYPVITDEDAFEVITAHDSATGVMIAALKLYRDEWDAADFGQLYIREDDGRVSHRTAINRSKGSSIIAERFRLGASWEWARVEDENGEARDDIAYLSRMPIIRFRNRRGVGVFEWHLDTLDRINDQILDKLVIAKIQAFRQMAVKGLPDTERRVGADGKVTEVEIDYDGAFVAEPGALWQVPKDVEFWESAITDIRPLLESIKDDLEHVAAGTKTPLHIITPDAAQGSAEGADLMRESNTYAVQRDRAQAAVGWRELVATAFAFMAEVDGAENAEAYQERADKAGIKVIWDPIRSYSLAEKADAASKAGTSLPQDAIARDIWQYPPDELAELRTMRGRDLLLAGGMGAGGQQGQPNLLPTFQRPGQPPANQPTPEGPEQ